MVHSVLKKMLIQAVVLVCTPCFVKCMELPPINFIADVATYYNRHGIFYHVPMMIQSDIHKYYKDMRQIRLQSNTTAMD